MRLSLDFVIDVDGAVAGEVGLRNFTDDPDRAELGVWVGTDHRRRGLASQCVSATTQWARHELGLQQLWCRTATANGAARTLFRSLGWQQLGESDGRVVWAC